MYFEDSHTKQAWEVYLSQAVKSKLPKIKKFMVFDLRPFPLPFSIPVLMIALIGFSS
jgi:hypothetical protein